MGWLALLIMVSSTIDMGAIGSIMPVVVLIVEPDAVLGNEHFQRVYRLIGDVPQRDLVIWAGAGAAALLTIAAFLNMLVQALVIRFSARCSTRLAGELMFECISAPYVWFLGRNSTLLTRLAYTDVTHWGSNFVQRVLYIAHNMMTLVLAVALVLIAAPLTGSVALAIVGALGCCILMLVRPYIQRMATLNRKAVDDVVLAADLGFSGIKDIKLSSRENYFTNLYNRAYRVAVMARARIAFVKGLPSILMIFLGQIAMLSIVIVLWLSGLSGGEIAAQMALLLLVSSRFIPALNRLSGDITTFWDGFPYIKGIEDTLSSIRNNKEQSNAETDSSTPLDWHTLTLLDVSYQYPAGSEAVICDLNLVIEAGKAYGVAGASGSGKSTLVDLIVGLLMPSSGRITVDGRSLAECGVRNWQRGVSYVSQTPFIADSTVRENIAFGVPKKEIDDDNVRRCLRMANLESLLDSLPQGLETPLGDRGVRLSGGQRQRVAIARALYDYKSVLILDEATSALDGETERGVQESIERLRGASTTITIAHRLTTLRRCDTIFMMENGTITDRGTFLELSRRHQSFRDALGQEGAGN